MLQIRDWSNPNRKIPYLSITELKGLTENILKDPLIVWNTKQGIALVLPLKSLGIFPKRSYILGMTIEKETFELRYLSDPVLRAKANPVGEVTPEIKKFMQDMLQRMYDEQGAGLAAPQIGVSKRIFVLDVRYREPDTKPMMLADPEIIWASDETVEMPEGCLSVPDLFFEIARPKEIKLRYKDEHNISRELHATGWLCRCIQHELDHLDGKLMIDYLSPLRKKMAIKKVEKFLRQLEEDKDYESVPS